MGIQFRLTVMNFMQFFVWGSWLTSLGAYMIATLGFTGGQVGSIFATMGLGSLLMPGLTGIVADRWMNAERVYGICTWQAVASCCGRRRSRTFAPCTRSCC